jgi:hypothetical protein
MGTVRLTTDISGTRDGQPWPGKGETVDVPDDEAAQLVDAGLAEDPDAHPPVETAVPADDAETATPKPRRGKADA